MIDGNIDPARVVNISSVAGVVAMAETPLAQEGSGTWSYNASKAAGMILLSFSFLLYDSFIIFISFV